MKKSIAKIYADAVKKNQKILYGVWEPGFPVQLGDYGVMSGNIFVHLGNISDIEEMRGFEIKKRIDNTKDEKLFTSQKGVEYKLTPKASLSVEGIPANASIEVGFTKEDSIFFNAAECQFEILENKHQIGQKLLEIHKQNKNKWKREFVLVTDRVVAKRVLILVSTSNDYSVVLEADAKIPTINLAEVSLGLNLKSQRSNGYQFFTEEGTIPLIGLSKIQSSFLWIAKDFKPSTTQYSKMMLETIENSHEIQTENSSEELTFRQYMDDLEE